MSPPKVSPDEIVSVLGNTPNGWSASHPDHPARHVRLAMQHVAMSLTIIRDCNVSADEAALRLADAIMTLNLALPSAAAIEVRDGRVKKPGGAS